MAQTQQFCTLLFSFALFFITCDAFTGSGKSISLARSPRARPLGPTSPLWHTQAPTNTSRRCPSAPLQCRTTELPILAATSSCSPASPASTAPMVQQCSVTWRGRIRAHTLRSGERGASVRAGTMRQALI